MESQRRDVTRNRTRILETARAALERGEALGFNAIAREADMGVATVYRHFASVEALEETLVWDRFEELDALLHAAETTRLDAILERYFGLLVSDALFEEVIGRPAPALDRTRELRDALIEDLAAVMSREKDAGRLRAGIAPGDLLALMCGIAHSARTLQLSAESARSRGLLAILLAGLRAVPADAA